MHYLTQCCKSSIKRNLLQTEINERSFTFNVTEIFKIKNILHYTINCLVTANRFWSFCTIIPNYLSILGTLHLLRGRYVRASFFSCLWSDDSNVRWIRIYAFLQTFLCYKLTIEVNAVCNIQCCKQLWNKLLLCFNDIQGMGQPTLKERYALHLAGYFYSLFSICNC